MRTLRPDNARPPTNIRRKCMKMKRIAALIAAFVLLCGSASAALSPLLPWLSAYNQYAEELYVPVLSMDMLNEKDEKLGYYSFQISTGTFIDLFYSKDNELEGVEVFVPVGNKRAENIFTACVLAADSTLTREDIAALFNDENVFYHKDGDAEYCYQTLGNWIVIFSKYSETDESAAFEVYSAISVDAYDSFFDAYDEETEDAPKDEPEDKDDGDKEQPGVEPAPTPVPDMKIHKL